MKFSFKNKESVVDGSVYYNDSESTIDYIPNSPGDIGILIGYLNLTFSSKTKKACEIWGYLPKIVWQYADLQKPKAEYGELMLEEEYEAGDNVRLIEAGDWAIYFDKDKKLLCIGDLKYTNEDIKAEFTKDIIAILRNHNLIAIWLQL